MEQTLGEMRLLADEMSNLETRDSVEVAPAEISLEEARAVGFDEGREAEIIAPAFNTSARKVRLDDESLRLPAGLSIEAKERLVTTTEARALLPQEEQVRIRETEPARGRASGLFAASAVKMDQTRKPGT